MVVALVGVAIVAALVLRAKQSDRKPAHTAFNNALTSSQGDEDTAQDTATDGIELSEMRGQAVVSPYEDGDTEA